MSKSKTPLIGQRPHEGTSPLSDRVLISSEHWIIGPKEDLVLFLGTPIVLLTLFALAQRVWSLIGFTVFATVLAMGHYLPGLMRAYGDTALFHRFRWRFSLAPLVLIATAIFMANYESQAFLLVVVIWGAWHWLMQTYGLVRIYDAKAKNFDTASARLDYALCISWFGILYWQTDGASAVLMRLYRAGAILHPELIQWCVRLWVVATAAITVWYLVHVIRRLQSGHTPSLLKFVLLSVSFFYYLYAFGYSSSRLVAYALFEGYHDIQYLAIVWIFNRGRAAKDPGAGAFTRFLFRQRAPLIILYVLLCVCFGSYDFLARKLDEGTLANSALGLITGLALVHFYFDGFIWRIREPQTRATLNVDGQLSSDQSPPLLSYARHGMIWAAFTIPVLALGIWEFSGGKYADADAYRSVLQARPTSHKARFLLSLKLKELGRTDEALFHIQQARALRPGFDMYDMLYADLKLSEKQISAEDLDEVIGCYERASVTRSDSVELQRNWAKALLRRGRLEAAAERYQTAITLEPQDTGTYLVYGTVLTRMGQMEAAADSFEEAIRIAPKSTEALAGLGLIRMNQGRVKEAIELTRQAIRLEPNRVGLLINLASWLATTDDPNLRAPAKAITLAKKALKLSKSSDPQVWHVLALCYAAANQKDLAATAAESAADLFSQAGQTKQAAEMLQLSKQFANQLP